MAYKLEKLNELIKEVLGRIILEEEEFGQGVLVTIMAAETSEDGLHCRVVISVFPDKKGQIVMEILTRHIYNLQQILNKKLQMRPVPKIRFVLDKTEAEAQELEEKMGK
ncbi:MAG: ribosome-binding factor A [bacterium]